MAVDSQLEVKMKEGDFCPRCKQVVRAELDSRYLTGLALVVILWAPGIGLVVGKIDHRVTLTVAVFLLIVGIKYFLRVVNPEKPRLRDMNVFSKVTLVYLLGQIVAAAGITLAMSGLFGIGIQSG